MAHPKIALSMFSQDLKEGIGAAHELEDLNNDRKETTKNIVKKIYKQLDERIEKSETKKLPEIVVIGSHDWNVGVLGILASKVLEKYNVNVFCYGGSGEEKSEEDFSNTTQDKNCEQQILSLDTTQTKSHKLIFKGSCRSRGDVHLVKLMTECKEEFVHFGGHELAGGFSISFDKVHTLEQKLNEKFKNAEIENIVEQKKANLKESFLKIDLHFVTNELLNALNLLGPFGIGNPKPIFKIEKILYTKVERFGKSREHLKLKLSGKNLKDQIIEIEAIKFFAEKELEENILEKYNSGNSRSGFLFLPNGMERVEKFYARKAMCCPKRKR
jgi:single-stranded-DNA-specific exonuclease